MTARRGGRDAWIVAAFALAHIALLGFLYQLLLQRFSGVALFHGFASHVVAGDLPYRDFPLEYPPFAVVFFTLPRLAASSLLWYYRWYQAEVVVFDLLGLVVIAAIARARGHSPLGLLFGYTIAIAAMGPIVGQQFDIFPAVLTLLALYCLWRGRETAGWAFLALGTMTKLYPLLTAPVWLLAFAGRGRASIAYSIRAARAFAITCAVVLLPWVVAPTSLRYFFGYHARRGIQTESTYATGILLADHFELTYAGLTNTFGSWNVTGDAADVLTTLSTPIFLAALIATYLWLRRNPAPRDDDGRVDVTWLGGAALLVLIVALLTSKVFSPQYLIWLAPFVALIPWSARALLWPLIAFAGAVTYYIFPMHYPELVSGTFSAEVALLVRNLLVVAMLIVVARAVRGVSRGAVAEVG